MTVGAGWGIIWRVAEELLERVLREIRERKQAAQAAYDESRRLEQALAALGPGSTDATAVHDRRSFRRGSRPRRERAAPGANRVRILALVRERPGVTAAEIAEATGIARSTVSTTLGRLVAGGEVQRVELPVGRPGFRARDDERTPVPAPEPEPPDATAASAQTPSASD